MPTFVFLDLSSTYSPVPFRICVYWKTSSRNTCRPNSRACNEIFYKLNLILCQTLKM